MSIKTISTLLFLFICSCLQAQFKNSNNNAMDTGLIPLGPGEFVHTFDNYTPKLAGSTYLSDKWSRANIVLNSDKLAEGYFSRYDLQNFALEVRVEDKVYKLLGNLIKEFTLDIEGENGELERTYFINPKYMGNWSGSKPMFLQALDTKGKHQLFLGTYTVVKPPNYNIALDVGSKDPTIVKKETYYVFDGTSFYKVPTRKKEFSKFFAKFDKNITAKIKKNKWSVKEKTDLLEIMAAINK